MVRELTVKTAAGCLFIDPTKLPSVIDFLRVTGVNPPQSPPKKTEGDSTRCSGPAQSVDGSLIVLVKRQDKFQDSPADSGGPISTKIPRCLRTGMQSACGGLTDLAHNPAR